MELDSRVSVVVCGRVHLVVHITLGGVQDMGNANTLQSRLIQSQSPRNQIKGDLRNLSHLYIQFSHKHQDYIF